MICIYEANNLDFSDNGLGPLSPSECTVTETLNGEWELTLVHPLDDFGKWERLQPGRIITAPVPAAMTPKVKLVNQTTEVKVYKVSVSSGKLKLYSAIGTGKKCLKSYKKNTEVILVEKTDNDWYEVTCPDGKRGYMAASGLTYDYTTTDIVSATEAVIPARQLRDQPFRIYRVIPELDKVTVYARHIFYDLLDNMLQKVAPSKKTLGADVVHAISAGCLSEHDFTFYSNLKTKAADVVFENINPIEALLGDGGVTEKYRGELARDWWDVFIVKRVGKDTDVTVREKKNLLGISEDTDLTNVVTRIMPTGQDKDGEVLYLPELYVDSPNILVYTHPKWIHLDVSDAKEVTVGDDKKTKEQCYEEMRAAAQEEFENNCDLPEVTMTVDFVSCENTVEYAQFVKLQNIFLGDAVRVLSPRLGIAVTMRMTEYTYDCLLKRYTDVTLGTVTGTLENSSVTGRQIASGSITNSKIAANAVGTGQLQSDSVGSAQIKMAAIESAHIKDAVITNAHIQDAAISTAKIEDASVTKAKIGSAAVGTAQIEDAAITKAKVGTAAIGTANIEDMAVTRAKIGDAAVGSAQIGEAVINAAHIGDSQIQTAHIQDAAIGSAKIEQGSILAAHIKDGEIDTAKIKDAAITNAKIGGAAIGTANIQDAAIVEAKILNGSVTRAKIADLSVDSAKIDDLAVTTAKIAQAAITGAKIADASIDTAKIALGAITSALIENGAVGTLQIADGSITDAKIVELTANKITAGLLSVERLIIRGNEQSIVYAINNMGELVSTEVNTIDGYVLTERTITADKIVANAITANEIAAKTITANEILANTITGAEIAAAAIEAGHIKAGSITTNLVSSDFGETLDLTSNVGLNIKIAQDVEEGLGRLRVGGTNLLRNTRTMKNYSLAEGMALNEGIDDFSVAEWPARETLGWYALMPIPSVSYASVGDKTVTVSFDVRSADYALINADPNQGLLLRLNLCNGGTTVPRRYGEIPLYDFILSDDWKRVNVTFLLDNAFFSSGGSGISTSDDVTLQLFDRSLYRMEARKLKLEIGNVPTEWSSAPEDSDEKLETRLMDVESSISTSADEIREEVRATYATTQGLSTLETQLSTLAEQTENNFTWSTTKINEIIDDARERGEATDEQLALIRTYMTFSEDGLTIGKTGNPFTFRVVNDRLAFYMNNTEVAYLSNNKLYVTQAEILDRMQLGNFAFEPQLNGNMSIVYTG